MLTMFVYRAEDWAYSGAGWDQSVTSVECQAPEQGQAQGEADPEMKASLNFCVPRCFSLLTLIPALVEFL